MPNALLVTTDFSANSKGAIRFAIQYATQTKQTLVFFHCLPYLKPTRWSDAQYDDYSRKEEERAVKELQKLVLRVYRSTGVRPPRFECIVRQSPDVRKAILKVAGETDAAAVCMSARGGGRVRKLLGTNTSGIIQTSPIPVFVIPASYRRSPVKHILYASDLNDVGTELRLIRNVAKPLKAKVSVVHYDVLADVEDAMARLEKVAKKYRHPNLKFRFEKYNVDKSLATHLLRDMKKTGASIAVLFTNQKRGWFDRLFLPSNSVGVAHSAKIPLLIMPK